MTKDKPLSPAQQRLLRQLHTGLTVRAVLSSFGLRSAYLFGPDGKRLPVPQAVNGDTLFILKRLGLIHEKDKRVKGQSWGTRFYSLTAEGRQVARKLAS